MIIRTADISDCGRYRYTLTRRWSIGSLMTFIMLNPSTADAAEDDATIRRCIGFARREGAAGLLVVNLFGLRATNPKALLCATDPFGPGNDKALRYAARQRQAYPTVCAWGTRGELLDADARALAILRDECAALVCLGRTERGHPRHPLYVRANQQFESLDHARAA